MADELNENIVELTKLTLRKALLEQDRQWISLSQKEKDARKAEIEQLDAQIKLHAKDIEVGKRTIEGISKELAAKKALQKLYEDQVKIIKQSGEAIKDQTKAIENLQKNMGVRNENITAGNIWGALKGLNFGKAAQMFTDAGKFTGVFANSMKAIGGAAGAASIALTALAAAGKYYLSDVLLPSIQKQNLIGQKLGIGLQERGLLSSFGIKDWITRMGFGLSSEQMIQMYSASAGALRSKTFEGTNLSDMYKSIAISNRVWGTDPNALGTIFRAYAQQGKIPMNMLAGHFNTLMESIKKTGMVNEEFTEIMTNSSMMLKNFGVSLDGFAKEIKGYGKYLEKGQLSTKDLTAQNMMSADTGRMGFLAKLLQDSGQVNLGISSNASPFALSRALKEKGLTNAQVTAMLKNIALQPGSQLSGLLSGARNARERELILAEVFSVPLQQLTPYHLVSDQMSASSFYGFGADRSLQTLGSKDKTMEEMETLATGATLMTGGFTGVTSVTTALVLGSLAKILAILKHAIGASEVVLKQFHGNEVPKVD